MARVRYASTSDHTTVNTHPFVQDGRLFAHNGVVEGLAELDARLAELGAAHLVHGQTDSERIFALISAETARQQGDLFDGLLAATNWISDHLPVYALNLVMSTATDLWALRYPAVHDLYLLNRPAGGAGASRALDARSSRIHAQSPHLATRACVLVASERMDDDPDWRLLDPGELLHVNSHLAIDSIRPPPPPRVTVSTSPISIRRRPCHRTPHHSSHECVTRLRSAVRESPDANPPAHRTCPSN